MSDLIPFGDNLPIPAFAKAKAKTNDLVSHASQGFKQLSIKGKVLAIVQDGVRKPLMNPKDPDSPATYVEVVILKANPKTSKTYYAEGYDPAAGDGVKPTCFSNDGIAPDAIVEKPQSKACATCPKNVYGAKITESGRKSKPCQDNVRVAVAAADGLTDPLLLRVPPASIRTLGDYGNQLQNRGIDYRAVITKVSFDPEEPTPKLCFRPVSLVSEEMFKKIDEMSASTLVARIIGEEPSGEVVAATATLIEKAKETSSAVASTEKVSVEAENVKAINAAKPSKDEAPKSIGDIDVDDLGFDD